ncbi:MAG TPA: QueG-associated DUF1730 domain-containing protein, partial [Polyangiaceae bacterium]|nr:QueG-associated DUF1730 domain-containing protein [Polyangiaceae bacterium]
MPNQTKLAPPDPAEGVSENPDCESRAPEGIEHFMPSAGDSPPMLPRELTPIELTRELQGWAPELGFERLGVTSVEPMEAGRRRLEVFREQGYAGGLDYLMTGSRHEPRRLMPSARSVVVALMAYSGPQAASEQDLIGRVARYARGEDYHIVLKQRLLALGRRLADLVQRPLLGRACVDTAPLLERELAARAGMGFQGKSTMFIAPGTGSYLLLGELLLELELAPTTGASSGCGQCRACLDACPTQAFPSPYVLD